MICGLLSINPLVKLKENLEIGINDQSKNEEHPVKQDAEKEPQVKQDAEKESTE